MPPASKKGAVSTKFVMLSKELLDLVTLADKPISKTFAAGWSASTGIGERLPRFNKIYKSSRLEPKNVES